MAPAQLPPAFAFLRNDPRTVADQAIVRALPHLDPAMQREALAMLIERSHAGTLAGLVAGFRGLSPTLRELVRSRAPALSAGISAAMTSSSAEARAAAIDLIVEGNADQLAYLLADALRGPCDVTRERAANGLARLAERFLDALESGCDGDAGSQESQSRHLGEALATAIARWDQHAQPAVLTAALALGELTESSLRRRIGSRHTKLSPALSRLYAHGPKPRLAASALRYLDIPEVRSGLETALRDPSNTTFLQALLQETWLLADPRIAGASRKLRCGAWSDVACRLSAEMFGAQVDGAVRFLASLGGPTEQREALLLNLLDTGNEEVRRAVVWQLIEDERESATNVLAVVASRRLDRTASIADRELRRRRRRWGAADGRTRGTDTGDAESACDPFNRLWSVFGRHNESSQSEALRAARAQSPDLLRRWLKERLAEVNPLDRVHALRITDALDSLQPLAESVLRLAHDPDALVRAQAVSLLPGIPGPVTQRILRSAINDPDERVQANAIEGLEKLDTPNHVGTIRAKLTSPHNRVRANAIKSLLGVELQEAGEALLDMLEDDSPSHRLSALWVIERMRLTALLDRLALLAEQDPDPKVRLRAARLRASLSGRGAALDGAAKRHPVGERR